MSDLNTSIPYLRAVLKEGILDLNDRPTAPKSVGEVLRDSRVLEAILLLLDRVEKLERETTKDQS